ncbi:acetate--CoA ligase family protein [Aquamicrobium sp. LC103]|uniref:acetate--CoA ligase family protein n=1 Tax=Aquamicrobium sp. LC103 TaxID=1120658 RepID=UPI0009E56312|nr:acetate--CoA ligase family protein [Aquamicrobium sp. LC103]TKT69629.1 acetate--CoA ligase family protein [Aquamicrobium sp. LC103]
MTLGQGLDALFRPRSIAVIGASQDVTKIGGRPLQLLLKYGYEGRIYPVNRNGGEVQGLPAFASVSDIAEAPELAVIAVPAQAALQAVEECGAKGVSAAVVLTAGFSEMGEEGALLQERIRETAKRSGMRVLGPNCLGSIGIPERSIATFSIVIEESLPKPGKVAIVSQSGNLASFTMRQAADRGIGISRFLATGNECDVDVADGIAYMARDPETEIILCCMETARDAGKLIGALDLARAAGKPVFVLKIGSSAAGSAAAASHTGALAGSDAVFDVVFRESGAVRVHSIEELINAGLASSVTGRGRLPKGNRVALLAASGGFGVMMADAASARGLIMPALAEETQRRILEVVPYASPRNPVDTTAQVSARPELLARVLNAVVEDESCDVTIILMSSSLFVPRLRDVYLAALEQVARQHPDKLLVLCCRGPEDAIARLNEMGFITIEGIDAVCSAVAALVRLGTTKAEGTPREKVEPAPPLPAAAFENESSAKRVLAEAGIPILREAVVRSVDEAAKAASEIGYPVVIKVLSPDIAHKSEVGGVVVGIKGEEELRKAFEGMMASVADKAPNAHVDGVLVVEMAEGGVELILGSKRDPIFGPVVMVGLGGIYAEIMQDVALQIAPVSEEQAFSMIRSLKAFPLLDGARGRPKADARAAAKAVAALSHFAASHASSVAEIDINPLLVRAEGQGAVALDALLVSATET